MLDGIVPVSKFLPMSRYDSDVMLPIELGMVPNIEVDPITKCVALLKAPISEGNDPDSPVLTNSIDRILG